MTVTDKHLQVRKSILRSARPLIGARGFSAVGLSHILDAAKIPKGSFYHYFSSKEHFGEALLEMYIEEYLEHTEILFEECNGSALDKMLAYGQWWRDTHLNGQIGDKCLIVKLAAEVSDLSERMRSILEVGTEKVVQLLDRVVIEGQKEGIISDMLPSYSVATMVYQMWLGATLMMKMTHTSQPFDIAMDATKNLFQ